MEFNIQSSRPIWQQLTMQLRQRIVTGAYPPGSRFPAVRELAAEAGLDVREAAFLLNAASPTVSLTDAQDEHAPQLEMVLIRGLGGIGGHTGFKKDLTVLDAAQDDVGVADVDG